MRIAWRDEKDSSYGSLGPCFVAINEPWGLSFVYKVSIHLPEELRQGGEEWVYLEIPERDLRSDPYTSALEQVKRIAVDKVREMGCRRRRTEREHDEAWLEELSKDILEMIQRTYQSYQDARRISKEHYYDPPRIEKYAPTTGYFAHYYDPEGVGHYLGRDHSLREIRSAIAVVLSRLESRGLIESMTFDRKRYWLMREG